MNIYLVQPSDGFGGWDKYDVMIVAASDEKEAAKLNTWSTQRQKDALKITFLGVTDVFSEPTVIFSFYHEG